MIEEYVTLMECHSRPCGANAPADRSKWPYAVKIAKILRGPHLFNFLHLDPQLLQSRSTLRNKRYLLATIRVLLSTVLVSKNLHISKKFPSLSLRRRRIE